MRIHRSLRHRATMTTMATMTAGAILTTLAGCFHPTYEWVHPDYTGEEAAQQKVKVENLCRAKIEALFGSPPYVLISAPYGCAFNVSRESREICERAVERQRDIKKAFERARASRITDLTFKCMEDAGWNVVRIEREGEQYQYQPY